MCECLFFMYRQPLVISQSEKTNLNGIITFLVSAPYPQYLNKQNFAQGSLLQEKLNLREQQKIVTLNIP